MADSDAEFEDGLRKDLPRGLKGREDSLPAHALGGAGRAAGQEWDYDRTAAAGCFSATAADATHRAGRTTGTR